MFPFAEVPPVPPDWFYAAVSGASVSGILLLLFNKLRQSNIDAAQQRKLTLEELAGARSELIEAWKSVDAERDKRRAVEHEHITVRNALDMSTALLQQCERDTAALRADLAGYRVDLANYRTEVADLRRIMTIRQVEGEHLAGRNNDGDPEP